jgi:hypothetical protein
MAWRSMAYAWSRKLTLAPIGCNDNVKGVATASV